MQEACKTVGRNAQTGKPKPQFMRFAPGEAQAALGPGWINNARSNLDPFKLALVKTELEGRIDRWLLSRV